MYMYTKRDYCSHVPLLCITFFFYRLERNVTLGLMLAVLSMLMIVTLLSLVVQIKCFLFTLKMVLSFQTLAMNMTHGFGHVPIILRGNMLCFLVLMVF